MKNIVLLIIGVILFVGVNGQGFNELAQTPPMGWNSWNKFGYEVNETLIMEMADHKKVYKVYDLWQHQLIGKTNEQLRVEIPAHGVLMVRLSEIEK